jgi:Ran GTPase-activating protein (RanGAP) involved in mRNA processing and transport
MSTPEELNLKLRAKWELLANCDELRRNDPSVIKLNLQVYGKIEWEDASRIAEALESNTLLKVLILSLKKEHLCVDGSVLLTHYLSSSPSLRSLLIYGDRSSAYTQSVSSILESVSHNKVLTNLTLKDIVFERPSLVENFLAKSRMLIRLAINESSAHPLRVYHAFRRGFEQNHSLERLDWTATSIKRSDSLEEVFFGLSNHPKLKTLVLDVDLTRASSQALRSCLCANGTLDYISLSLCQMEEDGHSTLEPVLLGLACNRGVTYFRMRGLTFSHISCATAWGELLQKNTSMKILELDNCSIGREDTSAIAQGLGGNVSLEKLELSDLCGASTFYGPAWQAMLMRNHSLKEITLPTCISSDEFEYFARGFAHNPSVKSLTFSRNNIGSGIGSTEANALADALLGNDTLESLDLSYNANDMTGAEDAAAVESLWRNHTLRHLTISWNVAGFPTDLPENLTLETINVSRNILEPDQCRAICESLRGSSCLREVNLSSNSITLDDDGAQVLNDLLENTPLRMLDFGHNIMTTQGMAVLANGLRDNSFLRELRLEMCEISDEGLIQLGEALVDNSTLEIIRLDGNDYDQDGVCQFFQLFSQMEGLKELSLDVFDDMANKELCSAVVDGLRKNTSLQRLSSCVSGDGMWHEEAPSDIKALIEFYLNLNRNGRKFLEPPLTSRVPASLWPSVLAKMSSPQDTSLLYYFLQKKPELAVRASRMNDE